MRELTLRSGFQHMSPNGFGIVIGYYGYRCGVKTLLRGWSLNRLAKSRRVQQSFIRHAFRYWMGRNELLSDSKTLIEAEKAYMDNGGSFQAMLISLLTSDSFIYRKHLN